MGGVEATYMGKILVDVIPLEAEDYRDGLKLEVHFGGTLANVAVGIAELGHRSAFVEAVGSDPFGGILRSFLKENGVDIEWLVRKNENGPCLL